MAIADDRRSPLGRKRTLLEIAESCSCFVDEALEYEEKAARKVLRPVVLVPVTKLQEKLAEIDPFDGVRIGRTFEGICKTYNLQTKEAFARMG